MAPSGLRDVEWAATGRSGPVRRVVRHRGRRRWPCSGRTEREDHRRPGRRRSRRADERQRAPRRGGRRQAPRPTSWLAGTSCTRRGPLDLLHPHGGENLTLAFRQSSNGRTWARRSIGRSSCSASRHRKQLGGTLSGGEQRMLALARVLADPPRLLIVDELSLGLAPIVVNEVYERLAELKDLGTTLLIVEQHVHHALAIADDVVILRKGQGRFLRAQGRSGRRGGAPRPRRRRLNRRRALPP